MPELRRDALRDEGGHRVIVTHCDGAFRTDAGPCKCGPDDDPGCWLIVLPCNCRNLNLAKLIRADAPGIDDVWPFDDRRQGVVVSVAGVCYEFIAAVTTRPEGLGELDFDEFDRTYPSCDESPCSAQPPCDCADGFTITLGNSVSATPGAVYACARPLSLCGIERIEATYSGIAHHLFDDQVPSPDLSEENTVEVSAGCVWIGASQLESVSGTGRARGFDDDREWDIEQSYTDPNTPGLTGRLRQLTIGNTLLPGVALLIFSPDGNNSAGIPQSMAGVAACCCQDGDSTPTRESSWTSSASLTLTQSRVVISWAETQWTTADRDTVAAERRTEVVVQSSRRIVLTSGAVIEDEECDRPDPLLARACDPEAPTQQQPYDPLQLADGVRTLVDPATGVRYRPTDEPTELPAVPLLPSMEDCPDPPDEPAVYRINQCNSTNPVGSAYEAVGTELIPRTVGYRPAEGMQPGEGHVRVNLPGAQGCLFGYAVQPTAIELSEEPELILTSIAGGCRGRPAVNVDPRGRCRDVDVGGDGGPSDADDVNLTNDPALLGEVARQQTAYGCSGCGG